MKAEAHAEPTKKKTHTMASEKRCGASNFLIKGIDAGAGPMILKSGEFTIRVEVTGWPKELGPQRPNLSWESVRRMVEALGQDEPKLEDDDEGVLDLPSRKQASA